MDESACFIPFDTPEDCCPGDVEFAAFHHDRFMERSVVPCQRPLKIFQDSSNGASALMGLPSRP